MNMVYQFRVIPFSLSTAHLGYTVAGYLLRQGISELPCLMDWLVYHPNHKFILPDRSAANARPDRLQINWMQSKTFSFSGSNLVWICICSPRTHAYNLSSWPCLSFYQVSAFMHGVTQLGLGSQTVESSVHETVTTFQLYGSDQRACSTAQVPLPTPSSSGPIPVVTLVGHSPPGQT